MSSLRFISSVFYIPFLLLPIAEAATFSVPCGDNTALINAINSANADVAVDTIQLGSGCTYNFSNLVNNWWYGPNALPAIASPILIEGNGATLNIGATKGTTNRLRFFYVGADPNYALTPGWTTPGAGNLTLRNLTLRGGLARGGDSSHGGGGAGMGGAIFNQGTLTLERVILTDNQALGGSTVNGEAVGGGGIGEDATGLNGAGFGWSTLPTPPGTASQGGTPGASLQGGGGGGGWSVADIGESPTTSTGGVGGGTEDGLGGYGGFYRINAPGGAGSGGGGESDGEGTNGSGGGGVGGGGGGQQATITVALSALGGNFGFGGQSASGSGGGGGFAGGGGASDALSNVYGGEGGFGGGSGASSLGGSWFGGRSGIYGGGAGGGLGGALFNHGGLMTLVNCLLHANTAQGGSSWDGDGGSGMGGALFNLNGLVTIKNSTVVNNTVVPGTGVDSESTTIIADADGGALYNAGIHLTTNLLAGITLINNILYGNNGDTNEVVNFAPFGEGFSNKASATTTAITPNIVESADAIGGTPPFTFNPVFVNAGAANYRLQFGASSAIDVGDNSGIIGYNVDLPGSPRIMGARVDLGAYETYPCYQRINLTAGQYKLISLACQPVSNTIADIFGDDLGSSEYARTWLLALSGPTINDRVVFPAANSMLKNKGGFGPQGPGYWMASSASVTVDVEGVQTPVVKESGCASTAGCFAIPLVPPVLNLIRFYEDNLVGNPFPYPVKWSDVRFDIPGTICRAPYTCSPTKAKLAGYIEDAFWTWNGSGYVIHKGTEYWPVNEGGFVRLLRPSSQVRGTIRLLVPAAAAAAFGDVSTANPNQR